MLLFLDEYFHVKCQRYWCVASRDINGQQILESDWTREFCPITCEPGFSQMRGNIFHLHYLQQKVMKKILKLHFGSILLILRQLRIIFLEILLQSLFNFFRFLLLCRISEKNLWRDSKKSWLQTYKWTNARTHWFKDKHEFMRPPLPGF